jgi:hypothetical protein
MRQLDQQPRIAVAQKRIALAKLLKDFDRVKITLSTISNECSSIKVTVSNESSGYNKTDGISDEDLNGNRQHLQQLNLIQTLQGKDVDEAIMRERERDLRKINQDLAMVNEMFRSD